MARIGILPPETARLIAAGEVVDRPASALRELLDNSIDADATDIKVSIESGGIDSIRIVDNGRGMSREDLELSIREHATSKIRTADDLLTARTLGFRGEALASIAAVSRLEITSREAESVSGWKITVEPGVSPRIEAISARQGTSVSVRGIFEKYPARRQFLKRPSSEAMLCHQSFVERALAHPAISFGWDSGAFTETLAPALPIERLGALYPDLPSSLLFSLMIEKENYSFTVLYADPSVHRRDRKFTQVFVNRRKVPEWGLLSVLEYAYSRYLPGGMRPCVFCFAEIDPSLADFNIHPAKREVRIKNLETIKASLYDGFKAALENNFGKSDSLKMVTIPDMETQGNRDSTHESPTGREKNFCSQPGIAYGQGTTISDQRLSADFWEKVKSTPKEEVSSIPQNGFRLLGHAFGPFIVFEMNSCLYILDQHAAHERILYDGILSRSPETQPLLVPYILDDLSAGQSALLERTIPQLSASGYAARKEDSVWIIESVPLLLGEEAIPALIEWLENEIEDLAGKSLVATMACRAAIKDGEILDENAARELIRMSLELPFPRCPHGRPIWVKLDKTSLYRMVGRLTG
jgi:DNA mismatch repair protein MutL